MGDQWAAVELGSHEMHTRAVLDITGIQRALMGAQARVFWQQRGMDIDHAAVPLPHEIRIDDAHVARADEQLWIELGDCSEQRLIKVCAIGEILRTPSERRYASLPRPFERLTVGLVRSDGEELNGQRSRCLRIDQGLQIGASPRAQDDHGKRGHDSGDHQERGAQPNGKPMGL